MPETYYEYTPEVLAIVCPVCAAAISGRCLQKTQWGKQYRAEPHAERIALAKAEDQGDATGG